MWQVLDSVLDWLNVVVHWRLYLCLAIALVIAVVIHGFVLTNPSRGYAVAGVIMLIGLVVGVVWDESS
jgi:hypothetical protein